MKNLFSATYSKQTQKVSVSTEDFTKQKLPEELEKELESVQEEGNLLGRAARLSLPQATILFGASLICLIFMLIFFALADEASSLLAAAQKNLWMLIIIAISFFITVVFSIIAVKKRKRVNQSLQMHLYKEREEKLKQKVKQAFNVPDNAPEIDVVISYYKEKNGEEKKKPSFNLLLEASVFVREDKLQFAFLDALDVIPLNYITATYEIRKKISVLLGDEKKKSLKTDPDCKRCVTEDQYNFYLKYYYSIRLSCSKGEFEIIIPPYDINKLASIVNLKSAF